MYGIAGKNGNGWHGPCRIRQGQGLNPGKYQYLKSGGGKELVKKMHISNMQTDNQSGGMSVPPGWKFLESKNWFLFVSMGPIPL